MFFNLLKILSAAHLSELRTQQERESSELVSVLPNGHLNLDSVPPQPSNGVATQEFSSSPSLEVKIADERKLHDF